MKLGIITDIHNNLIALNSALEYFEQQNCEKIICCGDIIGIGPYPEETVQRIMMVENLIAVKGNHDGYLVDGMPTEFPNEEHMDYGEMVHHKWEHSRLSESSIDFLKSLPEQAKVSVGRHEIAVMHYCMNAEGNYVNFVPKPTEDDVKKMAADVTSDIVIVGHDHGRTICNVDNKWYVNVGALGCPGRDRNVARAGILTIEKDNVDMEPVELTYDVDTVIRKIDELNYPEAENIKKFFYGIDVEESSDYNNQKYNFRSINENDYEFIYQVKKEAYQKYVEQYFGSWVEEQQRAYFKTFMETCKEGTFVITLDGHNIGFYNGIVTDDAYEIGNICIIPEYQNRGIGTAILKELLSKNTDRTISLQYFKSNPVGRLYERLGFRRSGETAYHFQMIKE